MENCFGRGWDGHDIHRHHHRTVAAGPDKTMNCLHQGGQQHEHTTTAVEANYGYRHDIHRHEHGTVTAGPN